MKTYKLQNHEIVFSVYEECGTPAQYLSIVPISLTDYGDSKWQANYVMCEIRLEIAGDYITADDYFTLQALTQFYENLKGIEKSTRPAEILLSVQHHFGLEMQWCPLTADVHFSGRIPAFEVTEQDRKELHRQQAILSTLTFEFCLALSKLSSPTNQLSMLLENLESLRPLV